MQELGSSGLCTKQKGNAGPEARGQQRLVLLRPPGRGIVSAEFPAALRCSAPREGHSDSSTKWMEQKP